MKPTTSTSYIDSTGQTFILHQSVDVYRGEYTNRPGKPDFQTTSEHVKKALHFKTWKPC
ncbi:MAG: hypothetical protein WC380_00155 [Pedobacter sp.]|jgi:hypothetical protein